MTDPKNERDTMLARAREFMVCWFAGIPLDEERFVGTLAALLTKVAAEARAEEREACIAALRECAAEYASDNSGSYSGMRGSRQTAKILDEAADMLRARARP